MKIYLTIVLCKINFIIQCSTHPIIIDLNNTITIKTSTYTTTSTTISATTTDEYDNPLLRLIYTIIAIIIVVSCFCCLCYKCNNDISIKNTYI